MSRTLAVIRNPLIDLPGVREALASLSPESRAALHALFVAVRNACRIKAQESWKKNKAPMACYWKVCGVYCHHFSRLTK